MSMGDRDIFQRFYASNPMMSVSKARCTVAEVWGFKPVAPRGVVGDVDFAMPAVGTPRPIFQHVAKARFPPFVSAYSFILRLT